MLILFLLSFSSLFLKFLAIFIVSRDFYDLGVLKVSSIKKHIHILFLPPCIHVFKQKLHG